MPLYTMGEYIIGAMMAAETLKTKRRTVNYANMDRLPAVLRPITGPLVYPTPAEIIEAKLDGLCPRCGDSIDCDGDLGLCHKCGFSF